MLSLLLHIISFSAALVLGIMTMTRAIIAVPKWQSSAQEPGIFAEFVSEAADGGSALCPVGYVYVQIPGRSR